MNSWLPCRMCGLCTQHEWRLSLVNWVPWDGESVWVATGNGTAVPTLVRYKVHTWLAECNIAGMTCALYPLRCRSRLLTVPKSCQLLWNTGNATYCTEQCQRSCKVRSNPSPGWLVSLRAWAHHHYCSLTNLDESTFLMAGFLCISLLLEVILWFYHFWIQSLDVSPLAHPQLCRCLQSHRQQVGKFPPRICGQSYQGYWTFLFN